MSNWKRDIASALALHKSMAICGEMPSDSSNELFSKAMKLLDSLDSQAIEAMLAVDVINGDIESWYDDRGYFDQGGDQVPTPMLVLEYVGTSYAVMFESFPIWSSEDDGREWPEGDEKEDLEPYLRKQVAKRISTLRDFPL